MGPQALTRWLLPIQSLDPSPRTGFEDGAGTGRHAPDAEGTDDLETRASAAKTGRIVIEREISARRVTKDRISENQVRGSRFAIAEILIWISEEIGAGNGQIGWRAAFECPMLVERDCGPMHVGDSPIQLDCGNVTLVKRTLSHVQI